MTSSENDVKNESGAKNENDVQRSATFDHSLNGQARHL